MYVDKVLGVLRQAARGAGQLALELQSDAGAQRVAMHKKDGSYALGADVSVESFLFSYLQQHMPVRYSVLSEESGSVALSGSDSLLLVIDPIDGTYNYARGLPDFAVSIGMVSGNTIVGGVVYVPKEDLLLWSYRGKGTFCNGQRISFAPHHPKPLVGIEAGSKKFPFEKVARINEFFRWERRESCVCGLINTVLGKYDGIVVSHVYAWDITAGASLLHEAGAVVTDEHGKRVTKDSLYVVAGTRAVHSQLMQCISDTASR